MTPPEGGPGRGSGATEEPAEPAADELQARHGAELPDREAMSLLDANVVIPIDAAVAANVLSDDSAAEAADAPPADADRPEA